LIVTVFGSDRAIAIRSFWFVRVSIPAESL